MEVTNEIKQRILEAIKANRENYTSDNKHAVGTWYFSKCL